MVFSVEACLVSFVLKSLEPTFNICLDIVGELWWTSFTCHFRPPETVSYPDGSGREFEDME